MNKIQSYLLIILVIIAGFFSSCDYDKEDILTVNSKLEIKQWSMENDGFFEINLSKFDSWEEDEFECVDDIDVDWIDDFATLKPKRECTVAVIDSSFDITHPAFSDVNFIGTDELIIDENSNHGMGVLSALCGNSKYIKSPLSGTEINILPIVAIDEEDGAQFETIVNAIKYAEAQGADICNLSIESYLDNEVLRETIQMSNMIFCVSSGNGGYNLDKVDLKVYPACYDFSNVITVADVRCDGKLSRQSNYGKRSIDIAAPGTDIIVACPGNGYEYMSGTSIATPIVAGIAALIYAYSEQELSNDELKSKILESAKYAKDIQDAVACSGIISMKFIANDIL